LPVAIRAPYRRAVSTPLSSTEMAVWQAFLHSHASVVRRLAAELVDEAGLPLPAYEALAHLSHTAQAGLSITDLSATLNLSLSGVSRLVDRLARDGYVERCRDRNDGRIVQVRLTEAGARRLAESYPVHLRGVREHFVDRFTETELTLLADLLGRVALPWRPDGDCAGPATDDDCPGPATDDDCPGPATDDDCVAEVVACEADAAGGPGAPAGAPGDRVTSPSTAPGSGSAR
jgi:DNA-binding MarR family transcriptional regulator